MRKEIRTLSSFSDLEDPKLPQNKIFKEDLETRLLTKKLTRKEQAKSQEQYNGLNSPTKLRGKPMGRRTGGRPCKKPRDMNLTSMEKPTTTKATKKNITVYSDTESDKSSTSGASEKGESKENKSNLVKSTLVKVLGTPSQSTQSKNHEKPTTKSQYNSTSTRFKPSLKALI